MSKRMKFRLFEYLPMKGYSIFWLFFLAVLAGFVDHIVDQINPRKYSL